jgi:hypothetical protein
VFATSEAAAELLSSETLLVLRFRLLLLLLMLPGALLATRAVAGRVLLQLPVMFAATAASNCTAELLRSAYSIQPENFGYSVVGIGAK